MIAKSKLTLFRIVQNKFGIRDLAVRYCMNRDGCEVDAADLSYMADMNEALMLLLPDQIWTKV